LNKVAKRPKAGRLQRKSFFPIYFKKNVSLEKRLQRKAPTIDHKMYGVDRPKKIIKKKLFQLGNPN
jgi:hypothetical protein